MTKHAGNEVNKPYIISVSVLSFVLPVISYCIEKALSHGTISYANLGKWFIFYAVGCRLLLAGIRQTFKPAFTAKAIFHMEGTESYPVIRELGFANFCTGLIGLISLFLPGWRVVSAFGSGLYFGLAGLQHALKKEAGINEKFALYTDLVIFAFLALFIISPFLKGA